MLARVFTERLTAFMVVIAFLKLGEADRRGESPGAELDRFTFRFTTGPPRTRRPRGLRGAVREISCSTNVVLSVPLIGLLARKRSRSTLAWASARFFPVNCLRRAVQQLHDSTVRVSGRTREGLIGLSACAVRVTIERSSIQDERSALALEMNSVSVNFSRQLCGQLLYWER
jgi:hypothetical protein